MLITNNTNIIKSKYIYICIYIYGIYIYIYTVYIYIYIYGIYIYICIKEIIYIFKLQHTCKNYIYNISRLIEVNSGSPTMQQCIC